MSFKTNYLIEVSLVLSEEPIRVYHYFCSNKFFRLNCSSLWFILLSGSCKNVLFNKWKLCASSSLLDQSYLLEHAREGLVHVLLKWAQKITGDQVTVNAKIVEMEAIPSSNWQRQRDTCVFIIWRMTVLSIIFGHNWKGWYWASAGILPRHSL